MEAAAALTDMYDQALLGILQHVGNVEEFLRVLFGFLYRKTDFYRLLLRPGDRLGFPPGAAQAMALQVPAGCLGLLYPTGLEGPPETAGPRRAVEVTRPGRAGCRVGGGGPGHRCCPRRWASPAAFVPSEPSGPCPPWLGACLPAGRPDLLHDGCGGDPGRVGETGNGDRAAPGLPTLPEEVEEEEAGEVSWQVGHEGGCWRGWEASPL